MLETIRTLFHLRGFFAGYKTYLAATAGVMATLSQFLSGQVIPYVEGDTTLVALIDGLPALVAQLSVYFAVGALRAGVEGKR